MSLKVNFFPLHFIISLLLLIAFVVIFGDTIYIYMSSNIYINGLIITLFIFCMLWTLGVLSYYSRSTRVLNKLLSIINPTSKKDSSQGSKMRRQALYVASSIAGTLIDSPVVSRVLATSIRNGRMDIGYTDASIVVEAVKENGERILGPSRFLTSLFTMLGLFGTFVGLLQTIDGVGRALAALANVSNVDILGFVKLLADPLQGMAVAFSTSLFGLVAALFGNYGNYIASQKLSLLIFKMKNFLTAASGVVTKDPNKIEARDILISLDESFNRLYTGLAERLDLVIDGIFVMSKAIVRTQERQEKLMKVIIDSFSSMEAMWSRMPKLAEYLKKISGLSGEISEMMVSNRAEMIQYFDDAVVVLLRRVADAVEGNVDLGVEIARTSKDISDSSYSNLNVMRDVLDNSNSLVGITSEISNINKELESAAKFSAGAVERISLSVDESNSISNMILSASTETVGISSDIRGISEAILNKIPVGEYTESFERVVSELVVSNNVSATLLDRIPEGAVGAIATSNETLYMVSTKLEEINATAKEILEGFAKNQEESVSAILSELSSSNTLADMSLSQLNSISSLSKEILDKVPEGVSGVIGEVVSNLSFSNQLSQSTLEEISRISQLSSSIADSINNNVLSVSTMLEEISNIRAISTDVSGYLANITAGSDSIDRNITEQLGVSRGILQASYDNSSYLQNMATTTSQNADAINDLSGVVTSVVGTITNTAQALSGMSANVSYDMDSLRSSFDEFKDRFVTILDTFQSSVETIGVATNVASNLEVSISDLNGLLGNITPTLYEVANSTSQNANAVSSVLGTLEEISVRSANLDSSLLDLNYSFTQSMQDVANQISDMKESTILYSDNISRNVETIASQIANSTNRDYDITSNLSALIEEFANLKSSYEEQMLSVGDNLAYSLDNILKSFDYISKNTEDMGSMVDRIDNMISQNSESVFVQSEALDNIRNEVANISDIQRNFSDNFSYDTSSISSGVGEFVNRLNSLEEVISDQVEALSSVNGSLGNIDGDNSQFLNSLSDQYNAMQGMVNDLVANLDDTTKFIGSIADEMIRQNDAIERNAQISEDVTNSLQDLSENSQILSETAKGITDVASNFLSLEDTLSKLDEVTANQEDIIEKFSSSLGDDIALLSDVVSQLSKVIEDGKEGQVGIQEDISKLASDVSHFVDRFEDFSKKGGDSEENSSIIASLEELTEGVSDIRNTLSSVLSEAVLANIKIIAESKSTDLGSLANNESVLNALQSIKDEYTNGNLRLDIIANAVDSLITEMLNSRDVAQSILDMVAKMGGFKRN